MQVYHDDECGRNASTERLALPGLPDRLGHLDLLELLLPDLEQGLDLTAHFGQLLLDGP
jgi:hypothetical protein